ncbi:LysM peptidoglycan-binding domain-containing protein [Tersicoccus sp. MR15.9]|uniref:LysM peptidoglycan-binding domain-containing protein n=1 Tax=Tersicoccus mangrovi TaxID=3121635 RepID=UPI002FE6AA27
MLSSLAFAEPAAAAPVQVPAHTVAHVPLVGAPAVQAPSRLAPMRAVPSRYTVQRGDSVWAIASRYGLNPTSVLALNRLTGASVIHPGQVLRLTGTVSAPARRAAAAPRPASAAPATPSTSYTVRSGDTLSAIAARHGIGLSSLLAANGLTMSSIIYPGQHLRLSGSQAPRVVASTAKPAPKPAAKPAAAPSGRYTIRSGDTLGGIANRHGISLQSLLNANHMTVRTIIYAGRTLVIPGRGTTVAPQSSSTKVPSTFLHYTYPKDVVADANKNKAALLAAHLPSPAQMQQIVASTARSMGVNPALAMAFAYQESGFSASAVSPANAIGVMQVIPSSGEWASQLVGRHLNLLNPYDNVTAGVAIIRSLVRSSKDLDHAIGSYYQGQGSLAQHGFFSDTRAYVNAVKAHMKRFS